MDNQNLAIETFTTTYSEIEDRIILSCSCNPKNIQLSLTQRLTQRLVPQLIAWIEKTGRASATRFDFRSPKTTLNAQHQNSENEWLVGSIDLNTTEDAIQLVFKGNNGQSAHITFTPPILQQWLEIAFETYTHAEWPTDVWSSWLTTHMHTHKQAAQAVWH